MQSKTYFMLANTFDVAKYNLIVKCYPFILGVTHNV